MKEKIKNIVFIFTLVIVIVVSLTITELVRLRSSYVRENPIPATPYSPGATYSVEATEPHVMPEPEATYEPAVTEAPEAPDDDALSILLVGNDGRRGAEGELDALVAARYEKTGGALKLVALSRELYVDIPGQGWDTLGRAYELGGMELLGDTVRHNFGIRLDGCLAADYSGLGAIIDALGGIEIELNEDEAASLGLAEGVNRLSGEQVLAFLTPEGIEAEVLEGRQRAVVLRVMEAVSELNGFSMLKLAYAAFPYINTDMNKLEVLTQAVRMYNGGVRSIETYSLPVEGGYEGGYVDGISVIYTDMEENRRLIGEWLYGG